VPQGTFDLQQVDAHRFRSREPARSLARLYGGEVAAQATLAALRTVPSGRTLNSMNAYFLRAGDAVEPVEYTVGRARDGGVFSARTVEATQDGRPILVLTASFQGEESGIEHHVSAPDVDGPAHVSPPDQAFALESVFAGWIAGVMKEIGVDVRFPDGTLLRRAARQGEPVLRVWMRTRDAVGSLRADRDAALVYLSDLLLLTAALEPHPYRIEDDDVWFATISHSVVMHEPWRSGDWLLYEGWSDWAGSGRCFVSGRLFDQAGRLCASTSQEGLLRLRCGPRRGRKNIFIDGNNPTT